MKSMQSVLMAVGAVAIMFLLAGQVAPAGPTFVKVGQTYTTSSGAQLTIVEPCGGDWYKVQAVIGGNSMSGPIWVNINRYEWLQAQQQ